MHQSTIPPPHSYGVALAALGMLSTLATGLTVDGFGPVSDNAGGIAEMSGMEEEVTVHVFDARSKAFEVNGNERYTPRIFHLFFSPSQPASLSLSVALSHVMSSHP
jgi:hypothetical protein